MRKPAKVKLDGREYVIVDRDEYERLSRVARAAEMPPPSKAGERGTFAAVDYARASIARDVVSERARLGLTQRDLARLARVRVETLCRIETGKHTASTATISKLDRALKQAAKGTRVSRR